MRYLTGPKYREYVKGYGFCYLPEHLMINMVKSAEKMLQQKLE